MISLAHRGAHMARQIKQNKIARSATDLKSNGKRAIRIKLKRSEGLAHFSALPLTFDQQTIFFQLPDNNRNSLGGKASEPCNLCFRIHDEPGRRTGACSESAQANALEFRRRSLAGDAACAP